MAIKKESAEVTAGADKLKDKTDAHVLPARKEPKEKKQDKNYEGGIDPQDEQLNTMPEDSGENKGDSKPADGNRIHDDPAS